MSGTRNTMPITFGLLDEVKQKIELVKKTDPGNTELLKGFAKIERSLKKNIANNNPDIDTFGHAQRRVRAQIAALSTNLSSKPTPTRFSSSPAQSATRSSSPTTSSYGSPPSSPTSSVVRGSYPPCTNARKFFSS